MSSLLMDLRVAVRALVKARAFSITAVTTLAVAIGATTAIFSVVDGVLLRPLSYPDADELVSVAAGVLPQAGGGDKAPFSDRGYWHFANANRSFEAFGAYSAGNTQWPLTGDGPPLQVDVGMMTASAFELIGAFPQRGRLPAAEEDVPDGPDLVLISDGLWVDRYGSDADIIGQTIELNGTSREVIGVMPRGYNFPTPQTDVWIPRQLDPASENFGGHHLAGIARLSDGVTIEAAVADAESLIARFDEIGYGPQWFEGVFSGTAVVRTLKDGIIGDSRQPLLVLLGTVGFVLLIACSNVANLLLVRAEARTRERAVSDGAWFRTGTSDPVRHDGEHTSGFDRWRPGYSAGLHWDAGTGIDGAGEHSPDPRNRDQRKRAGVHHGGDASQRSALWRASRGSGWFQEGLARSP